MNRPTLSERAPATGGAHATLTLPFESRQKSRLLATLDTGEEVGLILPRGNVLRGGDRLACSDGRIVEVIAASESVSVIPAVDARQLARAAYHLGNRHIEVQVAADSLRYLHDHVLDDMLRGLGFEVRYAMLPFEPEAGAYSQEHSTYAADAHSHSHGHSHAHTHD